MTYHHLARKVVIYVPIALSAAALGAQAPVLEKGTVRVGVSPPAWIFVDGARMNDVRSSEVQALVPVGRRVVRIVHEDYHDWVRVVTVRSNVALPISLALDERAVRKVPGAATRTLPPGLDPGIKDGIDFVMRGDMEAAVEVLGPGLKSLSGIPRYLGQQALGYLYLGAALSELDQPDLARRAFALARRLDRTLAPRPAEFPRRIQKLWFDSQAITTVEELDLTPVTASFAPPPVPPPAIAPVAGIAPTPPTSVGPSTPPGETSTSARTSPTVVTPDAPAPAGDFISVAGAITSLRFVAVMGDTRCVGALNLDRTTRTVEWAPVDPGCATGFTVPFDEVRAPGAAPYGGLSIQFRSERTGLTLMPLPDMDLVEPGLERMNYNAMPPETRVNLRVAHRRIVEALGRQYSESLFGLLVDVSLEELLNQAPEFEGGIVRTQGVLGRLRNEYTLSEEGVTVRLRTSQQTVALLRGKASEWIGKEMLISGPFGRTAVLPGNRDRNQAAAPFLLGITTIEPVDAFYSGPAKVMTIEDLFRDPPDRRLLVRVIGQYRGPNFFGDLPANSHKRNDDWIVKHDTFAMWVSGKRPEGKGFALSANTTKDTQTWLAITGTVEEHKGLPILKPSRIELSPAPSDLAALKPPVYGARPDRPDLKFVVPIPVTEQLSRDGSFAIQFTEPMDEESFEGRVQLRYADGSVAPFTRVDLRYSAERTFTLMIDPGVALQPGQTLECLLMPGIRDLGGQPLVGTDSGPRVLRWTVRPR